MNGLIGRTCAVTGLHVDRNAERLFQLHAVTAVVFLATGGIMALLLALTRWEAVGLINDAEWFYRIISVHGTVMLIFWILFFEIAGLIFGGVVLLNQRMVAPWMGWLSYGMMLVGALATLVVQLTGGATVMFTAYPPLEADSWFYLSVLVFAVGALLGVLQFLAQIVTARINGSVKSLPLFTFGLLTAAILALFTLLSGTLALVPAWLWSLGVVPSVEPGVYRLLFWGFGHGAQQVNLAAMVAIWYALAALTVGAKPLSQGLSRFAFVLYILFIQMGSMHHLIVDPGLGHWARGFNASYFVYAAVLGSMIHAYTIPASVEVAQRAKGFTRGILDWLRRAPWSEPGFSSLAVSFWLFGVLGGISGVIMGGIQVNMIAHNTLIVPAHFHMTVVAGTTLAFMGVTYYLAPLMFRRDLFLPSWAKWQPYVYGLGMTIFGIGMGLAGHAGLPRRSLDTSFDATPITTDIFQTPAIEMYLAWLGVGATIAVIGGGMFVVVAVGTVFLSKRSDTPAMPKLDPDALAVPEPGAAEEEHESHGAFETPGTLLLAGLWLLLFVVLYGYSWIELSGVSWTIR